MNHQNASIVALGDTHFPFSSRPAINKAIEFIHHTQPKHVVQVGDLYDMFAQSKFPHRLTLTPRDEKKLARHDADLFWSLVRQAAPRAERWQIRGNHCMRGEKRMIEIAPALEPFADFTSHWDFREWGVTTIFDPRQVLEIDGVHFTHGHFSKLGDHMRQLDFKNTVHGHTHRGGVHFQRLSTGRIAWELDCGYLGNPMHESLLYRPLNKFFHWTHGLGVIDELGPRFIPFEGV